MVSDRRIRDEIRSGAVDAEALAERCGAGSRCGGCQAVVAALLAETSVQLVGSA